MDCPCGKVQYEISPGAGASAAVLSSMDGWTDELEVTVGGDLLAVVEVGTPELTTIAITCGTYRAFPPGVPRTSTAACECEPGRFGLSCEPCPASTYKSEVGNNLAGCTRCPDGRMTVGEGETDESACQCFAGEVMENGECLACPPGHGERSRLQLHFKRQ